MLITWRFGPIWAILTLVLLHQQQGFASARVHRNHVSGAAQQQQALNPVLQSGEDAGTKRPSLYLSYHYASKINFTCQREWLISLFAEPVCCFNSAVHDADVGSPNTRSKRYNVRTPKDDPQQPIRSPDSYNQTCPSRAY